MAALFGELGANAIHKIAEANGWKDGSPEKIAMHAALAAVNAEIVKGNITAAAVTGGSIEALSNVILKAVGEAKGSSVSAQWAAAVVGPALSSATGGDAQSGASIAANAIKNNRLFTDKKVIKVEQVTWRIYENGVRQLPHTGLLFTYEDGTVHEVDFGNYTTLSYKGPGVIVQSDGIYMGEALVNKEASVVKVWTDQGEIKNIVNIINGYMDSSIEKGADVLREDKRQHMGENSLVYFNTGGKFEWCHLAPWLGETCLTFVNDVTGNDDGNIKTFAPIFQVRYEDLYKYYIANSVMD